MIEIKKLLEMKDKDYELQLQQIEKIIDYNLISKVQKGSYTIETCGEPVFYLSFNIVLDRNLEYSTQLYNPSSTSGFTTVTTTVELTDTHMLAIKKRFENMGYIFNYRYNSMWTIKIMCAMDDDLVD